VIVDFVCTIRLLKNGLSVETLLHTTLHSEHELHSLSFLTPQIHSTIMDEPTAADFAAAAALTDADIASLERDVDAGDSSASPAATMDEVKAFATGLSTWRRERQHAKLHPPTMRDVLQRAVPADALTGLDDDALSAALCATRRLDVTGMGLTACDGLDCFEAVTHFYAGMNFLPNFDGVDLWPKLRVLVAHDNAVTTLSHLRDLPQLQLLDLRRNRLCGTDWVDDLPAGLRQLSVEGNSDLDALDADGRASLLERLMARCPKLSNFDLCQPPVDADHSDDELHAIVDDADFLEDDTRKPSRLCLPVAGGVTSTIRSTTDDLVRRMTAMQSAGDADTSRGEDRSAALGNIRNEIIFALQHQRRVAASALQDGWDTGMRTLVPNPVATRPAATASAAYTKALAELRKK
jgi:hypothetical protein